MATQTAQKASQSSIRHSSGLANLTSAGNVTIANNPRLSAETGLLDNLREVSGKFDLRSNVGLQPSQVEAARDRFSKPVEVASR